MMNFANHDLIKQHSFFLIKFFRNYLKHYDGISKASWLRILLEFINDLATGVVFFLSLYFVEHLHFNATSAGIVISSYGVGKAIGGMLGGSLSDKFSPNLITISCLAIEALMLIAFIYTHTFVPLTIIAFILGISIYAFTTANKICVLNSIKDQENIQLKMLSIFYAASNLGLGMSAIYVSFIASFGFQYIFITSSILLSAATIFIFYQHTKEPTQDRVSTETKGIKKADNNSINNQYYFIATIILMCLFCIGLIIAQLGTTYTIYLTTTFPKLGINAVSILFSLNSFLIIVFQTPVTNYFNHYNKILMVGIGAFLMAGGMSLLSLVFFYPIAIMSMIIYTMGEMIFFSIAQLVVYQYSRENKKGQSLGLFQTMLAISMIIGPTLGGYIYENFGSLILWYGCGVIGLFWLIVSLFLKKYHLTESN